MSNFKSIRIINNAEASNACGVTKQISNISHGFTMHISRHPCVLDIYSMWELDPMFTISIIVASAAWSVFLVTYVVWILFLIAAFHCIRKELQEGFYSRLTLLCLNKFYNRGTIASIKAIYNAANLRVCQILGISSTHFT